MTCNHCCGADMLFDLKNAEKKRKSYRKKGPNKVTGMLIAAIKTYEINEKTLLDIGGGIGSIGLELNKKGLNTTTLVDASSGFIQIALEEAAHQNTRDKISTITGDFLDVKDQIPLHDIVTLDKVLCCYPGAFDLIRESTARCGTLYGLVFPWGGFFGRFFAQMGNLFIKYFLRNPFRTYIHEPKEVFAFVEKQGFQMIQKQTSFPWHVVLFQRKQAT